jgi:S1-C subfamily serine protease
VSLPPFSLLSSYLLFPLLQNIQYSPPLVKHYLPCPFFGLPCPSADCYRAYGGDAMYLERLLRQMIQNTRRRVACFVTLFTAIFCFLAVSASSEGPTDDAALSSAVCPIVYQLDQSPSSRGYHYSFFGNGFFINEQGYLLTAAHVLESFRNGGQPYILVSRPNSPPRLVKASIIAVDSEHDVAILRANSNPFTSKFKVSFLHLSSEPASAGESVLALSLHPPKQQNANTFQVPREDRFSGEVLSYESTQLEKSAPAAEVFLLSHPVNLGQSGSPVLALDSHAVVGFVEGRWLRSSAVAISKSSTRSPSTPGAAIPIRYAIALLQRQSITWHGPQPLPPASPAR